MSFLVPPSSPQRILSLADSYKTLPLFYETQEYDNDHFEGWWRERRWACAHHARAYLQVGFVVWWGRDGTSRPSIPSSFFFLFRSDRTLDPPAHTRINPMIRILNISHSIPSRKYARVDLTQPCPALPSAMNDLPKTTTAQEYLTPIFLTFFSNPIYQSAAPSSSATEARRWITKPRAVLMPTETYILLALLNRFTISERGGPWRSESIPPRPKGLGIKTMMAYLRHAWAHPCEWGQSDIRLVVKTLL